MFPSLEYLISYRSFKSNWFYLFLWPIFISLLWYNTVILKLSSSHCLTSFIPLSSPSSPLYPPLCLSSPQKWARLRPPSDPVPWAWAPATAPSSPCSMCPTIARTSTSLAARPPSPPTPSSSRPRPSRPPSRRCPHPRPRPSPSPPRPPRPLLPRRSPPRRRRSKVGRREVEERWTWPDLMRNSTPRTLPIRYLTALLSLMLATV